MGKVFTGKVNFVESKLVGGLDIDPNVDGEVMAKLALKLDPAELVGEVFQREANGAGKVFTFEPVISALEVAFKMKLDTDKDGVNVLELEGSVSTMEVSDEVLDAIAAARGKKLVAV